MAAKTTERQAPPWLPQRRSRPVLRLLYAGGAGPVHGWRRTLQAGAHPLGRDVAPDGVCLADDGRVSRRHATIHVAPDGSARVVDEHSTNGVFVNQRRVSSAPIGDGDVLRIGDSFLLLRHEDPDAGDGDGVAQTLRGDSPAIRALRARICQIAPLGETVLLLGESGSGKELAARAIHERSGRSGAFVALNCGAIPDSLAESHLFGHVAGAFTGARASTGYLRAAHQGTLLLDEIGELPAPLQPKLLRVLEERAVVPVGAQTPLPCDLRVVAATNRDLQQAVAAGTFRGDLYARLAGLVLELPPLRLRREDVLLLLCHALPDGEHRISPLLVDMLLGYHWPYNVRELFKVAATLASLPDPADLGLVLARLLPSPSASPMAEPAPGPDSSLTRDEVIAALTRHRGVVADAARALGCSRFRLYRLLRRHDIDLERLRGG